MKSMVELRDKVLDNKLKIDELIKYRPEFIATMARITEKGIHSKDETEALLRLCLDYYVYSETGDVLISDRDYDLVMNAWRANGHNTIIYPDAILNITQWPFIKHKIPGLVGTLDKIYEYDELRDFWKKYRGITKYIIAPKFDGISAAIEVANGEIECGATRYDGIVGQDITPIVKAASNARDICKTDGFYKCELCVSLDEFNQLITKKKYANRRSATSGIVNSPKNLKYAHHITIIPLLHYDKNRIDYKPMGAKLIDVYHPRDLLNEIENLLRSVREPSFPFRVDGVVIYPVSDTMLYVNETNLMQNAMAYKINTNEAKTKIEYGYMSIGRLGNAMPMVHLPPTEVNEVIVADASLGSYARYMKLAIHEDEEVIVFSAGDVIPQIRLQDPRIHCEGSPRLKIAKVCPYCNEKLERVVNTKNRSSSEYKCTNQDCIRVVTGRIANFIDKLGVMGFSDKTIEDLYEAGMVSGLSDLFEIRADQLATVPGYTIVKATEFCNTIQKLKETPIQTSELLGALGIDNISNLKCRKILEVISVDEVAKLKHDKAIRIAASADGIGTATATVFVEFVQENIKLIRHLMATMVIMIDTKWVGNIVFTKFTNREWELTFNRIRYEVKSGVNKNTTAVVCGSTAHDSKNCKMADRYGIPIIDFEDIEELYQRLKNKVNDKDDESSQSYIMDD